MKKLYGINVSIEKDGVIVQEYDHFMNGTIEEAKTAARELQRDVRELWEANGAKFDIQVNIYNLGDTTPNAHHLVDIGVDHQHMKAVGEYVYSFGDTIDVQPNIDPAILEWIENSDQYIGSVLTVVTADTDTEYIHTGVFEGAVGHDIILDTGEDELSISASEIIAVVEFTEEQEEEEISQWLAENHKSLVGQEIEIHTTSGDSFFGRTEFIGAIEEVTEDGSTIIVNIDGHLLSFDALEDIAEFYILEEEPIEEPRKTATRGKEKEDDDLIAEIFEILDDNIFDLSSVLSYLEVKLRTANELWPQFMNTRSLHSQIEKAYYKVCYLNTLIKNGQPIDKKVYLELLDLLSEAPDWRI